MRTSRLVPGRYPPVGTSPIADAIRVRRGARGLTPLDGTLLHVPSVAEGWNSLLGAVRSKGKLPGDVRELMVSSLSYRRIPQHYNPLLSDSTRRGMEPRRFRVDTA